MGSYDDSDLIYVKELLDCSAAEQPARSSWILPPGLHILLRIRPHQITEWPRSRNFLIPFQGSYGIDSCSFGWESSVDAEYFSFYDSGKWEIVKGVIEILPNVMIAVLFGYFIVESIDVGDVAGLVISS